MKGKVFLIFLSFGIVFCIGISVSYYNTRSYGFDQNASLVSWNDERVKVMDFEIYYNDINNNIYKIKDKISDFTPEKPIVIQLDTV